MLWLVTWREGGKRLGRTCFAETSGLALAWLLKQRPYVLADLDAQLRAEPYRTIAARRIA
jgi:hypothetical protein